MVDQRKQTGWLRKFSVAFRGLFLAFRTQSSFYVHLPCAAAVIAAGWLLDLDRPSFLVLLLCVAMVVSAELLNTSIELLAKAITSEENQTIGDALDIASGAVLAVSLVAVAIGGWVFVPAFFDLLRSP
jgi:diacylglycerol kinase